MITRGVSNLCRVRRRGDTDRALYYNSRGPDAEQGCEEIKMDVKVNCSCGWTDDCPLGDPGDTVYCEWCGEPCVVQLRSTETHGPLFTRYPDAPVVRQKYPECERCGEVTTHNDIAEVADGIVHQSCMRPGEEIA